jgi:hypothetical protein
LTLSTLENSLELATFMARRAIRKTTAIRKNPKKNATSAARKAIKKKIAIRKRELNHRKIKNL